MRDIGRYDIQHAPLNTLGARLDFTPHSLNLTADQVMHWLQTNKDRRFEIWERGPHDTNHRMVVGITYGTSIGENHDGT